MNSGCLAEGYSISDTVERLSTHASMRGLKDVQREESRTVLPGVFTNFPRFQTPEVPRYSFITVMIPHVLAC